MIKISNKSKTFFVADIGANHDGSLKRAKKLIKLAASSGADAAKFQHFNADTIVSDYGFKELNQGKKVTAISQRNSGHTRCRSTFHQIFNLKKTISERVFTVNM